jgi:hypothetical protein
MCGKIDGASVLIEEQSSLTHRHMDSSLSDSGTTGINASTSVTSNGRDGTIKPGMSAYKRSDFEAIAASHAHWAATRMNTSLHMAFVYGRRGILLGMATNKAGTRSSGAGYSKTTLHAERAALKAVGDMSMLKGAVLVVIRIHKSGAIMGSKPCHGCEMHLQKCMEKYALKAVYYS